ncbi:MAG: hypothetical protein HOQ26_12035 [Gemmatimonadaceae bacterium]|nr:hypothetical protein [Gemmatimonadaceae bacterium]
MSLARIGRAIRGSTVARSSRRRCSSSPAMIGTSSSPPFAPPGTGALQA